MASKTNVTEYRRKIRAKKAGAERKKFQENKGTTASFPIHTPAVDAAAPKAQVSPNK